MSTPDWNDEVWNAAVRYVGTSRNTDEERRLVARVIRAERALAADRVKQLEEALRRAVAQLESHGFDGHASGADEVLHGGPHDPR